MIKRILILFFVISYAFPVMAQEDNKQKLLAPQFKIKRDFPSAPTQENLESVESEIKPKIEITDPIEPVLIPETTKAEKAQTEKKAIKILPSKNEIKQEKAQKSEVEKKIDNIDIIRGLVWGISKDLVKEYEKVLPVGEEEGALFYVDDMWGFKSSIGYEFSNDMFWRAKVINEKYYVNTDDRIPDILAIQEALEEKFGEPTRADFIWLDDTDKDFPQFWGSALYQGHLKINIIWQFNDTEIKLIAEAIQKYRPQIRVEYSSNKYRPKIIRENILQF